jgi:hypothetical protein
VGASVTIYGTGLNTGAVLVRFNGTAATGYSVPSATQIVATVPAGATTGPISVTTGGGTATSTHDFAVQAPVIGSITPSTGPVSTEVRVSGTGFAGVSSVEFHGHPAIFSVNPAGTEIVTSVPGGATTGPISVTGAGGTAMSSSSFTVNQGPRITLLFWSSFGPVGSGVSINGMNFSDATSVKFNGVSAAYNVNSETHISATVPEGATTGPISVTTPLGTSVTADNFTVTKPSAPPPTISGFTPAFAPVGATVTITGTNFIGVGDVRFHLQASTDFTVSSPTTIHAVVPTGSFDAGKIKVIAEGGAAQSAEDFTVRWIFTVTGRSPQSGPVGTRVTITGTQLFLVSDVKFNGVGANFTSSSDASALVATVPPKATSGPIEVMNAFDWASPGTFTVVWPKPKIVSLSPLSGRRGTIVTIRGTGFRPSRGTGYVKFGAAKCGTYLSWSNTRIRCKVPARASFGKAYIRATTTSGTSNAKTFAVKR